MKIEHFYGADKRLQKFMYKLRRINFSEFSFEEQMIYWQFDPLSEHFIIFNDNIALGSISVTNYSNYPDTHEYYGLNNLISGYSPKLRIKGVHRLSINEEARNNFIVLRTLLTVAKEETQKNCDFFFGYVAPSKNNPQDKSRYQLGEKYCLISKAKPIGTRISQGIEQHFFGKWVRQ